MNKPQKFGLSAALISPFHSDGTVDLARLVTHAQHVLANGCDSLTLFGTTGEGFSIGLQDRALMLGAIAGSGIPLSEKVYAGVSATTIADAVEQASCALDLGAKGLLLAPPFYFKGVDDEGLYAWFSRVIEALGGSARGIILYHIPGQTAVPLSVALVDRLKQAFPQVIAGVKDSSGDWSSTQAFLQAHGELAILVGDERQLARGMQNGAEGSICGLANFVPGILRSLIHQGQDDARIVSLVELILQYPLLAAIKVLAGHQHKDHAYDTIRPPLSGLSGQQRIALTDAFDSIMTA